MEVVKFLDGADLAVDPLHPPQFDCESCGGETYPEYYKNNLGITFKISFLEKPSTPPISKTSFFEIERN